MAKRPTVYLLSEAEDSKVRDIYEQKIKPFLSADCLPDVQLDFDDFIAVVRALDLPSHLKIGIEDDRFITVKYVSSVYADKE